MTNSVNSNMAELIKNNMNNLKEDADKRLDDYLRKCKDTECEKKLLSESEMKKRALTIKLGLLEQDIEQKESELQFVEKKMEQTSKAVEESERARRSNETKLIQLEDRIESLENKFKDTMDLTDKLMRKYEDTARILIMAESDIEKAELRATYAHGKIKVLKVEVGETNISLRSLNIGEKKASQRADSYEESIREFTSDLKNAENRCTEAERTISKLRKEVDILEDNLEYERKFYKRLLD